MTEGNKRRDGEGGGGEAVFLRAEIYREMRAGTRELEGKN